jgi:RNA polymerase sigma factor (sigma-70 family)
MTPEEYINKHPFPENGAQINLELVKAIQDPEQGDSRESNLEKLLQNNARLIYLVYRQHNYNQELSSIMSFVYEGLRKSVDTFKPEVGMPFYHYAMRTIRGLLQNYYNYNHDMIHIPVMRKKDIKYEYADINDFNEHQYGIDESTLEDDGNLSDELSNIISEYEARATLNKRSREELDMLKRSRGMTLKALGDETGYKPAKLRKMIDTATEKVQRYYIRYKKDIG